MRMSRALLSIVYDELVARRESERPRVALYNTVRLQVPFQPSLRHVCLKRTPS